MHWFDRVVWFPLWAGLTAVGLVASWGAWRRRGVAAGLRAAAWSLVPLAAYLTGVVTLVWRVGTAVTRWVAGFAFSPTVWAGVALTGLAAALFGMSGVLRRRAPTATPSPPGRAVEPARPKLAAPPAKADAGEFADAEEILRRRGIR